jgi:ribonuclease P protein component
MKTRAADLKKIGPLLKRADFLIIGKVGRKWITPNLIVQMAQNTDQAAGVMCRLGLTVPKKIFKRAVDRNRVKRRIKAAMAGILCEFSPQERDFIVLPRSNSLNLPFETLEKDLRWAIKRLLAAENAENPGNEGKKC